jgi:hypothetical protein
MDDCLAGPNTLDANRMTPAGRLDEVADILASGLIRLRTPKSSRLSADRGDSCLDFAEHRSGHKPVETQTGGTS